MNFSDEVFQESLLAKDASLTWERIVKVREEDEQVRVFVGINEKDFALEAVSVFVFERDELVIINMDGDLNQMLEYAFEPARGQRGLAGYDEGCCVRICTDTLLKPGVLLR